MKKACFFNLPVMMVITLVLSAVVVMAGNQRGTGKGSTLKNLNPASRQPGLQPVPGFSVLFSGTGRFFLSADGAGFEPGTSTIEVEKPTPTATVYKAFLLSTSTTVPIPTGCVTLAGSPISWNGSVSVPWSGGSYHFYNYWADVTAIVAPLINPLDSGISSLPVGECPLTSLIGGEEAIEGESLLVIFHDATAPERTVLIMWGGLDQVMDDYAVILGLPRFHDLLVMGLGMSHSRQTGGYEDFTTVYYEDLPEQFFKTAGDEVYVKSSCAGASDDGTPVVGKLITVGGIGDTIPGAKSLPGIAPRCDCEKYNMAMNIVDSTRTLKFSLANSISTNNNTFLCYFVASGPVNILKDTVGIVLEQTGSSGCPGDPHTVEATLLDPDGYSLPDRLVNFLVLSGPNAGISGVGITNLRGTATFSYIGGGPGIDQVMATYAPAVGVPPISSNVLYFDWSCVSSIPALSEWGLIILGVLLVTAGVVLIRVRG